ncbi:O-antigen polymerase [Qipengyuania sphaerica]|uniref:O-antigen polymerase n=1 Tax=Qipengyuania sphaerica TaxID=2867243 RepID=UPI001C88063D|nr:O-antigen polymerase [Qipengyuania sphaerica]MBX7539817.1 oligosaccharide repeat unit polymerase [Qipengyuania sphaerica]
MYDFLLFASVIVFLGISLAYLRHPAASLAHPASFYLAFHGFLFVFRPIVARYYDFDFVYRLYQFQPSMTDKITVILGANLAMIVFVIASLAIAPRAFSPPDRSMIEEARRRMFWPIMIMTGLLTPIALVAQIGNWRLRVNDFETMVRDAATGNTVNLHGNGWFTDAALMMAPMAVMLIWLARYRWWGWIYFAVFAFLQAGTGTRHALIFAIAAIGVTLLMETGRKWFDWRAVILALVAAFAFNQIVIDRGGAVRQLVADDMGEGYVDENALDPLEHMDFANLEYFEYLVYVVPQRSGSYDYFANVLQVFTEPIPRRMWPDKPVGSPIKFFSLWDYGQPVGMTASLPGVGWMSLGYLGIIINALIFALIFAGAYRLLLGRYDGPIARLAYAFVICTSVLVFRDGTLVTLFRSVPFYFGPLLLALLIARVSGPRLVYTPIPDNRAPAAMTPAERRKALAARAGDTPR